MKQPRTIAVDFDGVIHSYTSGWTGVVPLDPPVANARGGIAGLKAMGYRVVVFTCRALTLEGRNATQAWLDQHGIEVDEVTGIKPHAVLYIDDRAYRFNGSWGQAVITASYMPQPWNTPQKRETPADARGPACAVCGYENLDVLPDGSYAGCGHKIPGAEAVS